MWDSESLGRWLRCLLPMLLLAGGVMALTSGWNVGRFQQLVSQAGPLAPLMFVLASVVMMSMLFPKTAVSLVAGALFGTLVGSGLMMVIAVAAAWLNYGIGRWWLHDAVLRQLRRFDTRAVAKSPSRLRVLHMAREMAVDAGFGFHLLMRLSPVPTMMISYLMGASGARIKPYLAAAAVAVIPQTLWVHGGSAVSLVQNTEAAWWQWASVIVSVVTAVVLSLWIPRAAMIRMQQWHLADHPMRAAASDSSEPLEPLMDLTLPNVSPMKRHAVYESAIDVWIAVMLLITPLAATAIGIYLVWIERGGDAAVMFLMAALTLVLTGAFTVPCRYTLLADTLSVRCGLICYQIPYRDIRRIEPSSSWLSGPALSLRRVLVATDRKRHYLSPKNREQFMAELMQATKDVLVAPPATADGG